MESTKLFPPIMFKASIKPLLRREVVGGKLQDGTWFVSGLNLRSPFSE